MKRNGIDRMHGRHLRILIENLKARYSLEILAMDDRKITRWVVISRV